MVKRIVTYITTFFAGVFSVIIFLLGRRSREDRDDNKESTTTNQPTEEDYRRVECSSEEVLKIIAEKRNCK